MIRAAICIAAFVLPAALVMGFRTAHPPGYFTFHQDRLAPMMAEAPLDYIAYGSSYVACHFSPSDIERESGLRGFNFGIGGLHGYDLETALMLSLRDLPARPRLVLIDLAEWPTPLQRKESSKPFASQSLIGSLHMAAWALRSGDASGALSQGRQYFAEKLRVGQPPWRPLIVNVEAREAFLREGYVPLPPKAWNATERNLLLKAMEANRLNHHRNLRVDLQGLSRLARILQARGITPVFVRSPISMRFRDEQPADYATLPNVLWFDDPAAFPAFFDPAFRDDPTHLNAEGSRLFSILLASRLRDLAGDLPRPSTASL